jgi:hypothetical protein
MLLLPILWFFVAIPAMGLSKEGQTFLLFKNIYQVVPISLQIGWQQISFLGIGKSHMHSKFNHRHQCVQFQSQVKFSKVY